MIPPPADGELARAVDSGALVASTQISRAAGDREYLARGECRAATPGDHYQYAITGDGEPLVSGDVPCDGSVLVNTVGVLEDGAVVRVQLTPASDGPGEAYLVVVPAPV